MRPITWLAVFLAVAFGLLFGPNAKADDGLYFEAGIGHDMKLDGDGSNPMSVLRLRYERATAWWAPDVLEWDHHSSVMNGAPFNHRPEKQTDQVSLIWRVKVW